MYKLGAFYDDVLDAGWSVPLHVAGLGLLLGAFGQLWLGLVLMAATPLGLAAIGAGYSLDKPGRSIGRERFTATIIGLGWLLMWVGAGAFISAGVETLNT